jgi:hypothetical protein
VGFFATLLMSFRQRRQLSIVILAFGAQRFSQLEPGDRGADVANRVVRPK